MHRAPRGALWRQGDQSMPNKNRKPAKAAKPSKPAQRVRLTIQATPTKKGKPDRPTPRTFVLYGADEFGKPRAAKFAADDKELLAKAAETRSDIGFATRGLDPPSHALEKLVSGLMPQGVVDGLEPVEVEKE